MSATAASPVTHQEWRRGEFSVSTDASRLDISLIHAFLAENYFDTKGIDKDTMAAAIRGSVCFGVYEGARQVGFARVVTDYARFAYLCDDFILEAYRGRGLARWMMECILGHPQLQAIRRWILGPTHDTRLYEKFGFKPLDSSQWLERMTHRS